MGIVDNVTFKNAREIYLFLEVSRGGQSFRSGLEFFFSSCCPRVVDWWP